MSKFIYKLANKNEIIDMMIACDTEDEIWKTVTKPLFKVAAIGILATIGWVALGNMSIDATAAVNELYGAAKALARNKGGELMP